jgi:hypothetical protein
MDISSYRKYNKIITNIVKFQKEFIRLIELPLEEKAHYDEFINGVEAIEAILRGRFNEYEIDALKTGLMILIAKEYDGHAYLRDMTLKYTDVLNRQRRMFIVSYVVILTAL